MPSTPAVSRNDEIACGIDVVDIDAFADVVRIRGPSFLSRAFTLGERRECGRNMARLAARFAAKEAVVKALGTGLTGIDLRDIEIRADPTGKPHVTLTGSAQEKARALGLASWGVSLAHSARVATAMVVASQRRWPDDDAFIAALAAARRTAETRRAVEAHR